ncbi:hypothetical protein AC249_AIPGENE15904, partial [Exaiptasia diaphana]
MDAKWIECKCKSGQTLYYYNKVTGERKWPCELYTSAQKYMRNPKNEDYTSQLEDDIADLSRKGDVVIQGDFNAHTGTMQEFILDDNGHTYLESLPEDYLPDIQVKRQSQDIATPDSR